MPIKIFFASDNAAFGERRSASRNGKKTIPEDGLGAAGGAYSPLKASWSASLIVALIVELIVALIASLIAPFIVPFIAPFIAVECVVECTV